MGNKQEELETHAHLRGYDIIGITEMWWGGSCDWSGGMQRYRPFRKDRQGRQGEDVVLYVNDQLECMELCLGWMRSQPRAYGSGLKAGQGQMTAVRVPEGTGR